MDGPRRKRESMEDVGFMDWRLDLTDKWELMVGSASGGKKLENRIYLFIFLNLEYLINDISCGSQKQSRWVGLFLNLNRNLNMWC